MSAAAVAKAFFDIFFPPLCPLCSSDIEVPTYGACERCTRIFTDKIITGPLCRRCGTPFRDAADGDHTCGACIKTPPPFVRARSLYVYEDEVREAVHELKYKWGTMVGPFFGQVMAEAVIRLDFTFDIIIPVPLHKNKLRKRGFNQSLVIARQMAKALDSDIDVKNFLRVRATSSQVGLGGLERRANMKGAFMVKDALAFRDKNVLLVDDVFTTGATITECVKVLNKAGARVSVITLARVVSRYP